MKVCVIGAGPSGLTTIKQLLDEGHDVVCFEKNADVGGIWHRHPDDADEMKAFDSLMLSISMKLMGFSDFMIEGERVFADRAGYLEYLRAYATKYHLRERIRFRSVVNEVRRRGDDWRVTVTNDGQRSEHEFGAVAVCSGPFRTPNKNVPDLDKFTGEVVHSSRYRNNRSFEGKRVLVVGLAESGADLVREISDVSSECTLSIRSRSFLLPRLFDGEHSTDMMTYRAHHYEMYVRATDVPYRMKALFGDDILSRSVFAACKTLYGLAAAASNVASKRLGRRARREEPEKNNLGQPLYPRKLDLFTENTPEHVEAINDWNLKSHHGDGNWSQKIIFCKNVSFIPNVVNGRIVVNDAGIAKIEDKDVHFEDGATKRFDAIVLCTGFIDDFSVLGDVRVEENNVRNLYKHCFHPEHGGRLALIGFVRPFGGGIPICAEMQARYFALLCSGKLALPANLSKVIEEEKRWEDHWTSLSPRHFESIPSQVMFLDSIAKEIGCLMSVSELALNPKLFVRHWFHSFNQSCYRLKGPHSMREAALKEMLSEQLPGRTSRHIWRHTKLSFLPYFMHPKDRFLPIPERQPVSSESSPTSRTDASPGASHVSVDHRASTTEPST